MLKPALHTLKTSLSAFPRLVPVVVMIVSTLVITGLIKDMQRVICAWHFILIGCLLLSVQRKIWTFSWALALLGCVLPLYSLLAGRNLLSEGTAVGILLVNSGTVLMMNARGRLTRVLLALGCISFLFAISLVNVLAYALDLKQAIGWHAFTSMAPLSSFLFALIGLSLIVMTLKQLTVPKHVRLVTTILVLSSSLLLTLFGWQAAVYVEKIQLKNQTAMKVQAMQDLVQAELQGFSKSLMRMAQRWVVAGSTPEYLWRADALGYFNHMVGITGVGYADAQTVIRWIEPKATNDAAEGFQLNSEPLRDYAIRMARLSQNAALTRAVSLKQGGLGFLLLVPLQNRGMELGLVYMAVRYEEFIRHHLRWEGYSLTIHEKGRVIFEDRQTHDFDASFWRITRPLEFDGTSWEFTLEPGPELINNTHSSMPLSILWVGLLFSFLTTTLQYLYFKTREAHEEGARLMRWNHAIVDGSQLGIISMNRDGLVKSFNPAAQNLLGYAADEVIEKASALLWHDDEELRLRALTLGEDLGRPIAAGIAVLVAKADLGGVDRQQWTYITKAKERRTVDLAIHALRDETTAIHGYVGIVEDISDKVRRDKELQDALSRAEVATLAKSRFLANMSHEIRTPINGILGMVRLLLDTRMQTEQKVYAEAIASSADNLLVIVNDILDLSKVEAGRLELEITAFHLPSLLRTVEANLEFAARKKGVALQNIMSADLPEHVKGDPTRIRQILLNLVSNAIKFTPAGQVVMKTSVVAKNSAGAQIRFEVMDTGIGIPKDALDKVFQPFVQADASTTRRFGGTGLGLSISQHLVLMMKGQIGVESEVDQGSRFWFTLDLPLAIQSPAAGSQGPEVIQDQLRILIVEDNAINQIVAKKSLQKYGYDLTVVNNGQEALDVLNQQSFHLILMDCEMPIMDGYEATRRIRSSGAAYQNIPIIAMTANAMMGDREHCLKAGMDDYITKPFAVQDVLSKVQKIIERSVA
ncbi:MAG TPA: ATP-binding protein [Oligoflexus sp.]|uniref:ATP-binding protein n=1 Tax=Oligoflexus sp. TaxID=1971216 RepID=UPI002D7F6A08|nr:ATP-binding protein [Oligoflexus sp.]HET9240418.1 ATP-binding protein [Oligoflexus sp.]